MGRCNGFRLEDDDDDGADVDDFDEDDSDVTMPCPQCLATVYDDAERCPECGSYVSREDAPSRPPAWIALTVGVCLLIVARWIFWT